MLFSYRQAFFLRFFLIFVLFCIQSCCFLAFCNLIFIFCNVIFNCNLLQNIKKDTVVRVVTTVSDHITRYLFLLCLATSNIMTDAAIAAFSDSTRPNIGIFTQISAAFDTSSRRPFPSFPIRIADPPA